MVHLPFQFPSTPFSSPSQHFLLENKKLLLVRLRTCKGQRRQLVRGGRPHSQGALSQPECEEIGGTGRGSRETRNPSLGKATRQPSTLQLHKKHRKRRSRTSSQPEQQSISQNSPRASGQQGHPVTRDTAPRVSVTQVDIPSPGSLPPLSSTIPSSKHIDAGSLRTRLEHDHGLNGTVLQVVRQGLAPSTHSLGV